MNGEPVQIVLDLSAFSVINLVINLWQIWLLYTILRLVLPVIRRVNDQYDRERAEQHPALRRARSYAQPKSDEVDEPE